MTTVNQYRVYCTTDSKYVTIWDTTEPTTCPENNGHSIDTNATTILDTIADTTVTIQEEQTPTQGHFAARTIKVNATKNTVTQSNIWWDYPISALMMDFITGAAHTGDCISAYIGQNTTTGALTANLSPASAWTSQNYTAGQTVTYTAPTYGARVYTCILDTVSSEVPTDTTYWRHGLECSVSSTVTSNIQLGYFLKFTDLTNSDEFLKVIHIDTSNNKVYVDTNVTNSYLAATPTYAQQTVAVIKDYEIGEPWEHSIGDSKIGGTWLPKDTIISVSYDNKSATDDKTFVGRVEYLY
jgi:hypothetical protein